MLVARSNVANVLGMLSLVGLMFVRAMVLNPLRMSGILPREGAVAELTILVIMSFLASLSGAKPWVAVFVAIILTLVFVLFFYQPLPRIDDQPSSAYSQATPAL